ncbi:MAG: hypothetical protein GTN84_16885 [Hydrogenophaga sp.]|uniref:hypothetical protein n=1 Tax=Hydrogenophaga sp. TaxID=1904254 RepID=UPI001698FF31|nr:hypothetical protein [Hydrogenophaga sp.]NIM42256.1 hypothetical protein [Hydrogenophaga sp.]NIN27988.1 hypothetical protein [Hydrogenophaga sp.]NIN32766.1 hypothetical protein [Hydrogenophaga sp.]NIN54655.1 hypothetical protein [Hydrogenophaga sp.]NIO51331.1 hypothetical protein [Hydrogenophaga sp.]
MKHRLRLLPLCVALSATPLLAGTPAEALRAADPGETPAAHTPPLPEPQQLDAPPTDTDLAQALARWREANRRVAEFPRGHMDLLRWEAARAPAPAPPAPAPALPLMPAEALNMSLRERPDLFTHTGMNPLEQARVRVAFAGHARTLQQAWIDAVALRASARLSAHELDTARTGTELGRRMVQAGNWPHARLLQEQRIEAEAWRAQGDATLAAQAALERLAGLLGLWRAAEVQALAERLPDALPAPPERMVAPAPDASPEAAALRGDPWLAIERAEAARLFTGLPEGRWEAWTRQRDAALQALAATDGGGTTPPHLDDLRLLREQRSQEAETQRARLLRMAGERRAMARLAWSQLAVRHTQALHADQVIAPLSDELQQDMQRRVNGMLESTWTLLASARERSAGLRTAVMARRDYWRAQAAWQALLAGDGFAIDGPSGAGQAPTSGNGTPH